MFDLARGKVTRMYPLSRYWSSIAVYGHQQGTNVGQYCVTTGQGVGSWWQVDLGTVYDIKLVMILNRRDLPGEFNKRAGTEMDIVRSNYFDMYGEGNPMFYKVKAALPRIAVCGQWSTFYTVFCGPLTNNASHSSYILPHSKPCHNKRCIQYL